MSSAPTSGVERIFWIVAFTCLGYCGIVAAETWLFHRVHLAAWAPGHAELPAVTQAPPPGAVIGRIDLPEVGIEAVVAEAVPPEAHVDLNSSRKGS